MSEWNESCTESISCIQVNGSIIKDQIGVLSVSVSQPAPQGHLVANRGTAWPWSGGCCCRHTGGSLVLSDTVFFPFSFFFIFALRPHDDIKDPLLREHTFMNLVHFKIDFKYPDFLILCGVFFPLFSIYLIILALRKLEQGQKVQLLIFNHSRP